MVEFKGRKNRVCSAPIISFCYCLKYYITISKCECMCYSPWVTTFSTLLIIIISYAKYSTDFLFGSASLLTENKTKQDLSVSKLHNKLSCILGYFIFSKLIFALKVAIIICYSNTPLCFFFDLSFCCNLCRYSFRARQFIKQIHLKYWHFP